MTADSAAPPSRVLLITNPISGGGRGAALAPALAEALESRGVAAEVFLTAGTGDAAARACAAGEEAWDGLVAIGGDGTVNEVLNGMPDPSRPLGVLPVGTANVLALELSLPREVDAAADVICAGALHPLAIGVAAGRRFLLFVGVGVDGAIVERVSAVRTGTLGKHKWLAPLLYTVWRWPQHRLRVTFEDGTSIDDASSVLVARVKQFGGVMTLPDADRDSGELHVLVFRMRSRLGWLYHGLRATLGVLRTGRHLTIRRAQRLRIDGVAPMQIDGDHLGDSPVEVHLLARRARVFAPAAMRRRG